mmetsp:Transcript_102314/g.181681  ORF Transcript_102314/g.181681 Transcript_102314/m.181681 type:complete len:192 (-) Transcript_102314:61-636(-)
MVRGRILPVAALLFAGTAVVQLTSTAFLTVVSRREALQAAAGAAAVLGAQAALADAQGEPIAALRIRGPQIWAMRKDVEAGDFKKVLKKEGQWQNLNSYWRNQKDEYDKKVAITETALIAAKNQDQAALQAAYNEYMSDPVFDCIKNPPPPTRGKVVNLEASGRNPYQGDPKATENLPYFGVGKTSASVEP